MSGAEAAVLTLYYAVLSMLTVYSVHRLYLVRLRRRPVPPSHTIASNWPSITIQLPLYNEPAVAERLVSAAASLVYPGELEIQVLDDSTDETTEILARSVERLRREGVRIAHIHRESRDGYKAGALANGMTLSSSELFAVFDADFVPPPDVLVRMVPLFSVRDVGMVQARWTHINRDESLLTRVQGLFLDAHFAVESAARNLGGRFFNFNGAAGIWRRTAIESAGGWSSSTLTEDLDLSYRAQLAGWKFVFLNDVEVPGELPAGMRGFQDQQHRWTKGSIQTARKVLRDVLRSDEPAAVKAEAVFHLTNNSAYLLNVLLALLIVPAMLIRYRLGLMILFSIDLVLFTASTGSVLLFYREGQRWAGRRLPHLRELAAVLPVGIGMSVRNAIAVVEGLFESGGHFVRTPKRGYGAGKTNRTSRWSARMPLAELALAVFFAISVTGCAAEGRWLAVPFLALFATGFSFVTINAVTSID